jgi:hypothetical protein
VVGADPSNPLHKNPVEFEQHINPAQYFSDQVQLKIFSIKNSNFLPLKRAI